MIAGVVVCPITSDDTAFRSARLVLAEWTGLTQKSLKNRLILTIPLMAAGAILANLDFTVLWRYCSWSNQTLAMISLWVTTSWLVRNGKKLWYSLLTGLPAAFMTAVSVTYILMAPEGFRLPARIGYPAGASAAAVLFALYLIFALKSGNRKIPADIQSNEGADQSHI